MIRYSDYNGCQNDVVVRDGAIIPFDRDAARDMARHAHLLAMDVSERSASEPVAEMDSALLHEAGLYA